MTSRPEAMDAARLARARLPNALVAHGLRSPGRTLLLWLFACLGVVPGLLELRIDTSTDSVLDRAHPDWQRYLQSQALFGGDEIIVVALESESRFDPERLRQVVTLSRAFERIEGVRRVDSLATVPAIRVDADGILELNAPLERAPLESDSLSAYVAERTRADLIAPRNFISEDERVLALNLVLDRGLEDRHAQMLEEIHAIVDPLGGIVSGVPVFRVAANARTGSEILFFAPITILVLGLFLGLVFRTPIAIAAGIAPGAIGSWVLVGMMGFTGSPLSITTMVLPSIMLALGCAYAMHFLCAARTQQAGLAVAFQRISLPVALSGLTTVVGLISITLVRIEAVQATGAYGALGVLVVTAVSLTGVPAILALRRAPLPEPRGFAWMSGPLAERLVVLTARSSATILVLWALFVGVIGLGIGRLSIETDATAWLPPGNAVRDDYERIRASLSGISPVNLIIRAPDGRTVLEPDGLAAIDGLTAYLEALPEVGRALSIAQPLRQLHGEFVG
jgi:predicted RND superfamily exporter protein